MPEIALHHEVRALLGAMEAAGRPPLESLPIEEGRQAAREFLKGLAGDPEAVARIEDLECPGPGGPIRVRVYTPEGHGLRPAFLHFHGGGWAVCDLDTHDVVCRAVARRSNAIVLSVDYRLAPENRFPAAVEDCYAATLWAVEKAGDFGIDPRRMATGGDSAGGNLAAVVSLKCRDEGGPALALQVLVYPVTNLASFDTASYHAFAEGYHLTTAQMEWFAALYCARPEDRSHPYASPLLAPDLRGLPPALVITAECDVLRDEGEAYARRLKQAGVPVTLTRYPGAIHGFAVMPGALSQGREALGQIAAAVRAISPIGVPVSG